MNGQIDPAHPEVSTESLYDVSSGIPHLVSLLPNGTHCTGTLLSGSLPAQSSHWISSDGSLVFFPCGKSLYMRDVEAAQTKLLSGPIVSGKDCGANFLKSTPEAAFLWTQNRLSAADTAPSACGGGADGDVYRYDTAAGTFKCLTCVVPGLDADVAGTASAIAVAEDGSRVYFTNITRLLAGAPQVGGTYRVEVATGDLAYIAAFSRCR